MVSQSSFSFPSHQGIGREKARVKDQVWPPGSTCMCVEERGAGSEGMKLAFPCLRNPSEC